MPGYTGGTPPTGDSATQNHYYGTNTSNLQGPSADGTDQVWVPEIFSKNVLMRFRRDSVVEGITNNDYFGEISAYGDTVKIIREPTVTIGNYSRGDTLTSTSFQDQEHTLVLDQAHQFQFQVDDLEDKFSHVNWEQLASGAATYNMKMAYDLNVLQYFEDQMLRIQLANKAVSTDLEDLNHVFYKRTAAATNVAADTTTAAIKTELLTTTPWQINNTGDGTGGIEVLDLLNKLALILDKRDVPQEDRFIVAQPEFADLLSQVDSKLINMDFRGGMMSLDNGLMMEAKVRGFHIYITNNATTGLILAGHKSAVATANSIVNTEKIRSPTTFADVVRGLHVFGRALVREEALTGAYVTYPSAG